MSNLAALDATIANFRLNPLNTPAIWVLRLIDQKRTFVYTIRMASIGLFRTFRLLRMIDYICKSGHSLATFSSASSRPRGSLMHTNIFFSF